MARLSVSTINGKIELDAAYAREDRIEAALNAGAILLAERTREAARKLNDKGYSTGGTARAVKIKKGDKPHTVDITFDGERMRGKTSTRNAAIAFYNEYGVKRRGIAARNWVKGTNEKYQDAVVDAMARELHKE